MDFTVDTLHVVAVIVLIIVAFAAIGVGSLLPDGQPFASVRKLWTTICCLAALGLSGLLVMCIVVYTDASGHFSYDNPTALIHTMQRANVSEVIIERGEMLRSADHQLLHVRVQRTIPFVGIVMHSSTSGSQIPTTSGSGDFYALYDPGPNNCDQRSYKGVPTKLCRDYGKAITFLIGSAASDGAHSSHSQQDSTEKTPSGGF